MCHVNRNLQREDQENHRLTSISTETEPKNARNPILKVEEWIISILKQINSQGKLDESLMKKLQLSGSQPPRQYGLAKIHNDNIFLRPVLSMPGSPYQGRSPIIRIVISSR